MSRDACLHHPKHKSHHAKEDESQQPSGPIQHHVRPLKEPMRQEGLQQLIQESHDSHQPHEADEGPPQPDRCLEVAGRYATQARRTR